MVTADRDKMRTVLDNLLSNAIKFTPKGGFITIRVTSTATSFVLEFADTGPGIPEHERPKIFEAFFQGQQEQGGQLAGTGIGLSVVLECIQAHDGAVELVDSGEFTGAHFRIHIPQQRAEADRGWQQMRKAGPTVTTARLVASIVIVATLAGCTATQDWLQRPQDGAADRERESRFARGGSVSARAVSAIDRRCLHSGGDRRRCQVSGHVDARSVNQAALRPRPGDPRPCRFRPGGCRKPVARRAVADRDAGAE